MIAAPVVIYLKVHIGRIVCGVLNTCSLHKNLNRNVVLLNVKFPKQFWSSSAKTEGKFWSEICLYFEEIVGNLLFFFVIHGNIEEILILDENQHV